MAQETSGPEAMLQGSQQGANRTEVITTQVAVPRPGLENLAQQLQPSEETGGSRSPLEVVEVGGEEINSRESTRIEPPPEVGKGSIADIFV